jgi:hypothetical protein
MRVNIPQLAAVTADVTAAVTASPSSFDLWKGPAGVGRRIDLCASETARGNVSSLGAAGGLTWTLAISDVRAVAEAQLANLGRGHLEANINTTASWGNAMAVCDETCVRMHLSRLASLGHIGHWPALHRRCGGHVLITD